MPVRVPLKTTLLIAGLTLAGNANAQRFCYYWVDEEGNADTYLTPPVGMAAPPFADLSSLKGHLVVAMTNKSCRKSVLLSKPTQLAIERAQARTPVATPGVEISPAAVPQDSVLPQPIDNGSRDAPAPQPIDSEAAAPVPQPIE